jgi:hypothetical protein
MIGQRPRGEARLLGRPGAFVDRLHRDELVGRVDMVEGKGDAQGKGHGGFVLIERGQSAMAGGRIQSSLSSRTQPLEAQLPPSTGMIAPVM